MRVKQNDVKKKGRRTDWWQPKTRQSSCYQSNATQDNYPDCLRLSLSSRRLKMPMKKIARHYLCHFCHHKVIICHACDRGNIYCGTTCSQLGRRASRRAADQKYQNNQKGKLKHAERQRRYRLRYKKIVTDHSSKPLPTYDLLLPITDKTSGHTGNKTTTSDDRCHFCRSTINKWAFDDGKH